MGTEACVVGCKGGRCTVAKLLLRVRCVVCMPAGVDALAGTATGLLAQPIADSRVAVPASAACCYGSWTPCCAERRAWAAGRWAGCCRMASHRMHPWLPGRIVMCSQLGAGIGHPRMREPSAGIPCSAALPTEALLTPPSWCAKDRQPSALHSPLLLAPLPPGGQPGAGGRGGRAGGHAQPGRRAGGALVNFRFNPICHCPLEHCRRAPLFLLCYTPCAHQARPAAEMWCAPHRTRPAPLLTTPLLTCTTPPSPPCGTRRASGLTGRRWWWLRS